MLVKHPQSKPEKHQCPNSYCLRVFDYEQVLKRHLLSCSAAKTEVID